MTKEDLIRFLEPFREEIRVVININGKVFEIDHMRYGLHDGEGFAVIQQGEQITLPLRV
jgi:hypothetical protein